MKEYINYYNNPTIENAESLYEYITKEYKIDNIYPPPLIGSKDILEFTSNGSTGKPTKYLFGPNGTFWLNKIERLLRQSNFIILVNSPMQFSEISPKLEIRNWKTSQHDIVITCDLRINPFEICEEFRRIYEKHGKFSLLALPHIFLYMFSNEIYSDLIKPEWIESLINTDCDPFFKKKHKVNDQMMNWKTGENFYTCKFGKKHVLPITYNKINLLNNYTTYIDHDIINISHYRQCECGKKNVEIEFIPHSKNQIKINDLVYRPIEMVEDLKANYLNLQFCQNNDVINVYYEMVKHIENDLEIIESWFPEFNLVFHSKKYYKVGTKLLTFWNGEVSCMMSKAQSVLKNCQII